MDPSTTKDPQEPPEAQDSTGVSTRPDPYGTSVADRATTPAVSVFGPPANPKRVSKPTPKTNLGHSESKSASAKNSADPAETAEEGRRLFVSSGRGTSQVQAPSVRVRPDPAFLSRQFTDAPVDPVPSDDEREPDERAPTRFSRSPRPLVSGQSSLSAMPPPAQTGDPALLAEIEQTRQRLNFLENQRRSSSLSASPPPGSQQFRVEARGAGLDRLRQENPREFKVPETQQIQSLLGSTGHTVSHTPPSPHHPFPSESLGNMIYQSSPEYFAVDHVARRGEVNAVYTAQIQQQYVESQLTKALTSLDTFYAFLSKRHIFAPRDPESGAFNTLMHYIRIIMSLATDPTEGWKVARSFVELLFQEIADSRARLQPVSLQQLLGFPPFDGNYGRALESCPLYLATLHRLMLRSVTTPSFKDSSKGKRQPEKSKDKRKSKKDSSQQGPDGFPGSPFRTEAAPKYCSYHNGWFASHGSDDCRFKGNPAIRKRPGNVSGDSAPSL